MTVQHLDGSIVEYVKTVAQNKNLIKARLDCRFNRITSSTMLHIGRL
jgi:hypothetical protein